MNAQLTSWLATTGELAEEVFAPALPMVKLTPCECSSKGCSITHREGNRTLQKNVYMSNEERSNTTLEGTANHFHLGELWHKQQWGETPVLWDGCDGPG